MESQLLPYASASSELQKRLFTIIETCHSVLESSPVPLPEPSKDLEIFDVPYSSSLGPYLAELRQTQAALHQTQRSIIRADKWAVKFRAEHQIGHDQCVLQTKDPEMIVLQNDPVLDNCCFWCITRLLPEDIVDWVDWLRVVVLNVQRCVEQHQQGQPQQQGQQQLQEHPSSQHAQPGVSPAVSSPSSSSPSSSQPLPLENTMQQQPPPPQSPAKGKKPPQTVYNKAKPPIIPHQFPPQKPSAPTTTTTTTTPGASQHSAAANHNQVAGDQSEQKGSHREHKTAAPSPQERMEDDDFSFDVSLDDDVNAIDAMDIVPLNTSVSPLPEPIPTHRTPPGANTLQSPSQSQLHCPQQHHVEDLARLKDLTTSLQAKLSASEHEVNRLRVQNEVLVQEKQRLQHQLDTQIKQATATSGNAIELSRLQTLTTQLQQQVQQQRDEIHHLKQRQAYPGWHQEEGEESKQTQQQQQQRYTQPKGTKYQRTGAGRFGASSGGGDDANNDDDDGYHLSYPQQQQQQQQSLPDGFTTASRMAYGNNNNNNNNNNNTRQPPTPSPYGTPSTSMTSGARPPAAPAAVGPPRPGKFRPPQPIAPSQNHAAKNILNDNPNYYEELRQQQQHQQQQQYRGPNGMHKAIPTPPQNRQPANAYYQNNNPNMGNNTHNNAQYNAAIVNNTSMNPAIKKALLHNPNNPPPAAASNRNHANPSNTNGQKLQGNAGDGSEQRTHIGCIELNPDGTLPEPLQGLDITLVEAVMNDMLNTDTGVQWDDIAGLTHCKQAIKECLIWPLMRPDLFQGLRDPPSGMLLFGPPGTGKTMLGKAIANQCNARFFSVSASSLTSKWYGQGEKLVRTLFAICRYLSPCVLFMDEVDSVMGSRSEGENDALRRLKTELLVQMDGLTNSANTTNTTSQMGSDGGTGMKPGIGVIVIAATNLPQELDDAARRRLVKRVYVPLPGFTARRQLIHILLQKEQHSLLPRDIDWVAQRTREYSAADIKQLCVEAAFVQLRHGLASISSLSTTSLHGGGEHHQEISMDNHSDLDAIQLRPVSREDFVAALDAIRPSVNMDSINGYYKWNDSYGSYRIPPADADEVIPSQDGDADSGAGGGAGPRHAGGHAGGHTGGHTGGSGPLEVPDRMAVAP